MGVRGRVCVCVVRVCVLGVGGSGVSGGWG